MIRNRFILSKRVGYFHIENILKDFKYDIWISYVADEKILITSQKDATDIADKLNKYYNVGKYNKFKPIFLEDESNKDKIKEIIKIIKSLNH